MNVKACRTHAIMSCVRKMAYITLGIAIATFGVYNIHAQAGITEGGVIGAILLLNHWFDIPASIASPVLDAICMLLALKVLGVRFLGWSVYAGVVGSLCYRLWESIPYMLPNLSNVPLIAALAGGVFVGVGVGLVVRQGSSSGGDDALALSIARLTGWRVAHCYLVTDLSVLVLSLSYVAPVQIACSLVAVLISSFLIDHISEMARPSWLRLPWPSSVELEAPAAQTAAQES